jgi:hypothetical protein
MATILPLEPNNAGVLAPYAASAPGGDEIKYSGGDLAIEFDNGHNASITVNIAPTKTTAVVPGAGRVTVPPRTLAIGAGLKGVFLFKASDIRNYINANGRIPVTYTGGNVAMLVRALRSN